MAGIDFDRQVFVPPADQAPTKQPSRILGVLILAVAISGIGFVAYKLMSDASLNGTSAEANSLQQIQQQLADMNQRLDQLEKRHKTAAPEAAVATPKPSPAHSDTTTRPRPAYQISAASSLSPQRNPNPITQSPAARPAAPAPANDAERESWQATTDRLGDVVGAVGSQEAEITQTRDELNQLLSQTRRSALQFELTRGTGRQSVGPVELLLKGSDPRSQ